MAAFTFNTVRRVVVEQGGIRRVGDLASLLIGERGTSQPTVLIVTDSFLAGSGLLEPARQALREAGLQVCEFTGVEPDPSEKVVFGALEVAKARQADLVLGIGGGSSMDVAKIVACLAAAPQLQLSQLYGVESVRTSRLPLLMVPTTAGTGSEVTSIAIVTTGASTKAGIVNTALLADLVLLDAELTLGLPPAITAATGIDAMVHAIEAYTSVLRKNPVSDMLAREALRLLSGHLLRACDNGKDIEARQAMMIGAMLAGQAFENAPVAAVHALAYPLGGIHHLAHGVSNSLVLPHVMSFNSPACAGLYAELAQVVLPGVQGSTEQRCQAFIEHMARLSARTGLPQRLRDCQIDQGAIEELATSSMGQQRLLKNNPREVTLDDARAIYQAAW